MVTLVHRTQWLGGLVQEDGNDVMDSADARKILKDVLRNLPAHRSLAKEYFT